MLRSDHTTRNQLAFLSRHCNGKDALSATLVLRILGHRRTLSVALLGNNKEVTVAICNLHAKHSCFTLEHNTAHP